MLLKTTMTMFLLKLMTTTTCQKELEVLNNNRSNIFAVRKSISKELYASTKHFNNLSKFNHGLYNKSIVTAYTSEYFGKVGHKSFSSTSRIQQGNIQFHKTKDFISK